MNGTVAPWEPRFQDPHGWQNPRMLKSPIYTAQYLQITHTVFPPISNNLQIVYNTQHSLKAMQIVVLWVVQGTMTKKSVPPQNRCIPFPKYTNVKPMDSGDPLYLHSLLNFSVIINFPFLLQFLQVNIESLGTIFYTFKFFSCFSINLFALHLWNFT